VESPKNGPFLSLDDASPSVQTHLEVIQGVVQRMALNSASCKTWCITLVSAILVVVADKGKPSLAWLTVMPIVLFAGLDVHYLALEKGFRKSYNSFVHKLHNHELLASDLYSVEPTGNLSALQLQAMKSVSVWGFYISLIVLGTVVLLAIS
jgi:hypothetical protein